MAQSLQQRLSKFTVHDLPLFLLPTFPTRFSSMVLVQWYGIDQVTNRVGLRLELPTTTQPRDFLTFEKCVSFLMKSAPAPSNVETCWTAFSSSTIVAFLQCDPVNRPKYTLQYQFPLAEFIKCINQLPKERYVFEQPCQKHDSVRSFHKFIATHKDDIENEHAESKEHSEKTEHGENPEQEKGPTINWNDLEAVDHYFANVGVRLTTSCQNDPPLKTISEWKAESCGGWDMKFLCQLEGIKTKRWLHYAELQINAEYKKILNEFIASQPTIVKHVKESSL